MYTYLETGEWLKCRKCGAEASFSDTTTEGLKFGCSKCGEVITGDHAEAMCFEQRLYVEAGLYKDKVRQAGSSNGIPIPELVKKRKEQLTPGDQEAYPLRVPLTDPNWPFHYQLLMPDANTLYQGNKSHARW